MSFMMKATGLTIAGNSPAEAAHPPETNGMMVSVDANVAIEAIPPRMPKFLSRNPATATRT
jgi:hypothetical protein